LDELEFSSALKDSIIARLKIMANLRIDEHRLPQD
jgi:type II secretory ATPase GspE/PulE/Tfp pilus assembly ATPase PilB-like protein